MGTGENNRTAEIADKKALPMKVMQSIKHLNVTTTNEYSFTVWTEHLQDVGYTRLEAEYHVSILIESMGFHDIDHIVGGRHGKKDGPNHRVYIAFRPEQIYSASKNIGTFDSQNSDIRYSLRSEKPYTDREIMSQIDHSKQNRTEQHYLNLYQNWIQQLAQGEPQLNELQAQIKELESDGKRHLELNDQVSQKRYLRISVDSIDSRYLSSRAGQVLSCR